MRGIRSLLLGAALCAASLAGSVVSPVGIFAAEAAKTADAGKAASPAEPPPPWPRTFSQDGTQIIMHQPQLDSWEGNTLKGRAAVAVKTGKVKDEAGKEHDTLDWGALEFSARTDVDKVNHRVTLRDMAVVKLSFPTAKDKEAHYGDLLKKILDRHDGHVASLDQFESDLAISQAVAGVKSLPVKNDPPDIIFSFEPALLVLIDGPPKFKPTGAGNVERVVNTKPLLLKQGGEYYLVIAGQWLIASSIDGKYNKAVGVSTALAEAKTAAEKTGTVDTLDKPPPELKKVFDAGKVPTIKVSSKPAELIIVDGDPQFVDIPDTQLSYVENTPSDVFVDKSKDNAWYVLISGRWFTAPSSNGPWAYVDGKALPADFAKIASDSPKSAVLASIPGTPEAREALISNSIPQTATVNRKSAQLKVDYDGAAQFKPIEGTTLSYAWNTDTPVIKVGDSEYYSVENGVWFTAKDAHGPWSVAIEVPPVIYTIPTSSPLHYVTYVRVYGSTDQYAYDGYTPGYYGTVVSDNVVVYGTGYTNCDPWVGDLWYGCPTTYGNAVSFGYDPWVGWGYGYYWGWAWAAAWYGCWWGPWGGYWPGYWGGAIATANIYGRWGNSVVGGVGAAWANPWTGNYGRAARGSYYNTATGGRGAGFAARNTNIYTGTTRAAAGGIRYNPQTGRVVAGAGGGAYNAYSGNAVAGGARVTANTNTGRVTASAGGAARTDSGTTVGGGFKSAGAGSDISGAGFAHKDSGTGQVTTGGVIKAGDNVYAGKDGNVYKYTPGEGWQAVDRPTPTERGNAGGDANRAKNTDFSGIDADRAARDRGSQRDSQRAARSDYGSASFDRSSYNRSYNGNMGGARYGGSTGSFRGGGMRGGGGRGGGRR